MASASSPHPDSSTPAKSCQSNKQEATAVARIVRKESNKDSITIVVAQESRLGKLETACKYSRFKPRGQEEPPILFTTAENLQKTIDGITSPSSRHVLNILVSTRVQEILFHVPSHYTTLKVLRCILDHDGGSLIIDGSSTYNNIRLDNWQARQRNHHTLVIGVEGGVRVRLNHLPQNWTRRRRDLSDGEKEALRQEFKRQLISEGKKNDDDDDDSTGRDQTRTMVASILGLAWGVVISGSKIVVTPHGIDIMFKFGQHLFRAQPSFSRLATIATAAGPATIIGAAALVALYHIPWKAVYDWLKTTFSWLWDDICQFWERFKDGVLRWFGSQSSEATTKRALPIPMGFSG